MKEIIFSLPDQIHQALDLVPKTKFPGMKPELVVCCGMGGSGISSEILGALYPEIPIIPNKDYPVPDYAGRKTLAIFISYSGNTEETLNNYRLLAPRCGRRVILTSGGKLFQKSAELKIRVPAGLPPRGALGFLFTPLPFILHRFGMARTDPRPELLALVRFLTANRAAVCREAGKTAKRFVGKLPVIYSDTRAFTSVANRWRCQLNENSKILCHTNVIPEMNHNEIVGLGRPMKFNKDTLLVFLHDPETSPRNLKREKIMKDIIRGDIKDILEINPKGGNRIERMFWTIMLGDFISFYLAEMTGVDPLPVKRIEYLKKRLKD
jgi:glucose/mannose-6-phosphate isomerase